MSVQNDVAIVDAKDYQESTVNAAIDKMFAYLGLDPGNPFAGIIQPGMRVVYQAQLGGIPVAYILWA